MVSIGFNTFAESVYKCLCVFSEVWSRTSSTNFLTYSLQDNYDYNQKNPATLYTSSTREYRLELDVKADVLKIPIITNPKLHSRNEILKALGGSTWGKDNKMQSICPAGRKVCCTNLGSGMHIKKRQACQNTGLRPRQETFWCRQGITAKYLAEGSIYNNRCTGRLTDRHSTPYTESLSTSIWTLFQWMSFSKSYNNILQTKNSSSRVPASCWYNSGLDIVVD